MLTMYVLCGRWPCRLIPQCCVGCEPALSPCARLGVHLQVVARGPMMPQLRAGFVLDILRVLSVCIGGGQRWDR